jgi:hypothetical protein
MFDHEHHVAGVHEPVQAVKQPLDIRKMKAGRWLVEDIQVVRTSFNFAELRRQLDALFCHKYTKIQPYLNYAQFTMLLVMLGLISLIGGVSVAASSGFVDVKSNHWAIVHAAGTKD